MRILMLNEFKNKYVNTENSFSFILSQQMFFIIIQLSLFDDNINYWFRLLL